MIHFNYITTNKINGKKYVGSHSANDIINDRYLGSGLCLLKAIKKYGKANFTRDILNKTSTFERAFENEKYLIQMYNTLLPNGYNLSPTGGLGAIGQFSEETKEKIRLANIGKKISEETREKLRKSHLGIKPSIESRKKMSEAAKGSANAIGNTCTKGMEWIHKSNQNKMIKENKEYYLNNGWEFGLSNETKRKMRLRVCSEEHKKNLSKAKIGNNNAAGNTATKGTRWIHNKEFQKNQMVKGELLKGRLNNGWELGMIKISKK